MITRCAVFVGQVKPGQEAAMRAYVTDTLAPLWRRFANAQDVRVLFSVEQDATGPVIPLMLQISYADTEAMARGLNSPARYASRDLLPEFYARFFVDVVLWHYVYDNG